MHSVSATCSCIMVKVSRHSRVGTSETGRRQGGGVARYRAIILKNNVEHPMWAFAPPSNIKWQNRSKRRYAGDCCFGDAFQWATVKFPYFWPAMG